MQLAEFLIEIRERSGSTASDEMATDPTLTRFVNHGLGQIEAERPDGWPWLRLPEAPIPLTDGVGLYAFADISGSDVWRRIRRLRILTGAEWQELEPMNERSMRNAFPNTVGSMPQAWSTDGYNLLIRPVPVGGWTAQADVVIGEPTLVNPTDVPLLSDVFSDVLVDYCVYLLLRRRGDTQGAQVALAAYNDGVKGMRMMARTQGGPAHVALRDPWE